MGAQDYGNKYFVIRTFDDREAIYLYAERVEVIDRCLVFWGKGDNVKDNIVFAINDGYWTSFAAAEVIDGHEVAVAQWIKPIGRPGGGGQI